MSRSTSRVRAGARRHVLVAAGLGIVVATVGAGCASGQIAETAQINPAVQGTHATVGSIALRDIQVAFPQGSVYQQGQDARLTLVIVNAGLTDDTLTSVRTDAASDVTFATGEAGATPSLLPTQTESPTPSVSPSASASGTPSGTASGTPSGTPSGAPVTGSHSLPAGATQASLPVPANSSVLAYGDGARITLVGLTRTVRVAESLRVTFTFRHAGSVTVTVPVRVSPSPLPKPPAVDVTPTVEP